MLTALRRLAVKACATTILTAAIFGTPVWLILAVGWPLPDQIPTGESLTATISGTVTDQMVVDLIAIGIWLAWAAFAHAVIVETHAVVQGRARLHPARNPMRGAATVLIGAALMGTIMSATAAASTSSPAHATTAPPEAAADRPVAVVMTEAVPLSTTVHVGTQRYTYTVVRGDYLSKIAQAWLGDANRWPELCDLNRHRHFPSVGGTLTDCNLIYPGWDLILPEDATPPPNATPAPATPQTPTETLPDPETPPTIPLPPPTLPPVTPPATANPEPTPAPSTPAASPSTSTSPLPSATPSASASASPAPTAAVEATPSGAATSATPAAVEATGQTEADHHGVRLPGHTWVPWAFAAAVSAAASAVWLQRRRRYRGRLDDRPVTELPAAVADLRREVRRNPAIAVPQDTAAQAAAVPDLTPLPPGGIGLLGDGAHHAARAAIAETLASGGPLEPTQRGEVIIDAHTLITLIGPDAITLGPWPRLHIADNLDHALTLVEERLLHRSRLLDEHQLSDVDTLAAQIPDEEPLPPILLVTETPATGSRQRAKISIALGTGLGISALLLGEWLHGATLNVGSDGHTRLACGQPEGDIPPRMAILEPDPAIAILTTLREAHTGEPTPTAAELPMAADASDAKENRAPDTPRPAAHITAGSQAPTQARARLWVLGKPRIDNSAESDYHVRAKAYELAVYLACHRDGKTVPQLVDVLELDGRAKQAEGRVHTTISNLRVALAEFSGIRHRYIVKDEARRHKLDPAEVDIDLWQLQTLVTQARHAPAETRTDLLRQACDLYAPLAEGESWEWLEPHQEAVRRLGLQAHMQLADDLLATDPRTAITVLEAAMVIDPYNEAVYTQAMRARHAIGDADGIRNLLRALNSALSDMDAEPQEETIALARQLRASLDKK